jgi:hypothetical protein
MKLFLILFTAALLSAQTLKLPPSIEKLAETAEETVDITIDGSMLQFSERLLSDRNGDQARAKRVLRNLKSVTVKSFEFGRIGAYSTAEVDDLRKQLQGPGWSRVVEVRSRRDGDNVDVFMRAENAQISGLIVISAEPRELTIVELNGAIRPEDLHDLRGMAGIPRWDLAWRSAK